MERGYEEWFAAKVAQRVDRGDARYVALTQASPSRIAAEAINHLEEDGQIDSCFAILIPFEMLAQRNAILCAVARNAPDDWQLERSEIDDHQTSFRVSFTCRQEVNVQGPAQELVLSGYSLLAEFSGDTYASARVVQKTVCIMVWTGNEDDMQTERFTMVGALGLNPIQQHVWDNAVQLAGEKELTELLGRIQDGGVTLNEPQQEKRPCVHESHHILDKPSR